MAEFDSNSFRNAHVDRRLRHQLYLKLSMKMVTPDRIKNRPAPVELESYWKIRYNEFRAWLRPRWARIENAAQARNREDDMPGNPDRDADRPGAGLPIPFVVICTAMMTVLITVFVIGGHAENHREHSPEEAEIVAQLAEQKRAFDRELAMAHAEAVSVAEKVSKLEKTLETFDAERLRLTQANADLEKERQRLAGEVEASRQRVVVVEPTGKTYTVRSGDTLSSISRRSGVSVAEIVRLNGLASPNHLSAGQQLVLPPGVDLEVASRLSNLPR
ncbi:MAG: hypothetical protein ACI8UO_002360 [Verrucomicrobiales bacterium]